MNERFYKLPVEIARRRDLTSAGKVVWAALADRVGNNGFCWPGVRTAADDTGLDVKTVLRATKELERAGLLEVERRGNGRVNYYRIVPDQSAGETPAPAKQKRWRNGTTGAGEMPAQALEKLQHNQTKEPDQLNQSKSTHAQTRFVVENTRNDFERGKDRNRGNRAGEFIR